MKQKQSGFDYAMKFFVGFLVGGITYFYTNNFALSAWIGFVVMCLLILLTRINET